MNDLTSPGGPLAVLGRVPSGIYILTIRSPCGVYRTGMLCSWVMQAGFEPPMLSVAVKQGRFITEWIEAGAPFAIQVVASGGKRLLNHFAKGFEKEEPAFADLEIESGPEQLPLLRDDILGWLVCRSSGYLDSGDHRVYLAEVTDGGLRDAQRPMTHVRNSGRHY